MIIMIRVLQMETLWCGVFLDVTHLRFPSMRNVMSICMPSLPNGRVHSHELARMLLGAAGSFVSGLVSPAPVSILHIAMSHAMNL